MKLVGRVTTPDGPLKEAAVEVVSTEGGKLVTIGKGAVIDGAFSATANPGPVWGVRIDGQPIVTFPVSSDGEVVDLGDIEIVRDGLLWPAFHAPDGRVYGRPRIAQPNAGATATASFGATAAPRLLLDQLPRVAKTITLGGLYGNTAQQLDESTSMIGSRFALAGATVTLKGVATATENAVALEFPAGDAPLNTGTLSEISFSIQPRATVVPAPPPVPSTAPAPNLVGYTREFAIRKASVAGFVTEVNHEIVATDADAGRVMRQLPAPGAALASGGLIRLYIGKAGG